MRKSIIVFLFIMVFVVGCVRNIVDNNSSINTTILPNNTINDSTPVNTTVVLNDTLTNNTVNNTVVVVVNGTIENSPEDSDPEYLRYRDTGLIDESISDISSLS